MTKIKDSRNHIRVGIKQIPSIVKSGGDFELVEGNEKMAKAQIHITDISYGGLCIESKHGLREGVSIVLEIPDIKNLGQGSLDCQVTRSLFREDPRYHVNLGTDRDKSYFEIGLKFKAPNSVYIKKLYHLAVNKEI